MSKCRTNLQSADYWESRLKKAGLTMNAGLSACLSYGFDSNQLDYDGRHVRTVELDGDKRDEWPVSV
jgi:hypothetical protein